MIALIILGGCIAAAATGVFMWRWITVYEHIAVERAKAGGDERAKEIAELSRRVDVLESYTKGG